MASRWYLTASAAEISPSIKGTWANTSNAVTALLDPIKAGSVSTVSYTITQTGLHYIMVSKVIAAQTISGTLTAMALVSSSGNTAAWQIHAYVTQGNSTSLVRGTLVSSAAGGGSNWPAAAAGRASSALAMSSVTAQAGDRVVVELGCTGVTIQSRTMDHGGTGSDLTESDTNTTHVGWVEFSNTISFVGPGIRAWILE